MVERPGAGETSAYELFHRSGKEQRDLARGGVEEEKGGEKKGGE